MVSSQGYTAMAYTFSVVLAISLATYAFIKGYLLRQKIVDTESFLTARGQVGWYRVAWSFYAGAVGAWVITSPAGYASFAGMLGLCMYSLAAGLPFLMIAYGGDVIRKRLPHVCSLTDFMGYRYGEMTKAVVCLIILFNMSIALLAEYYTIGLIFRYFVRSVPYAMVIVVGTYRFPGIAVVVVVAAAVVAVGDWANAVGTSRQSQVAGWTGSPELADSGSGWRAVSTVRSCLIILILILALTISLFRSLARQASSPWPTRHTVASWFPYLRTPFRELPACSFSSSWHSTWPSHSGRERCRRTRA